MEIKIVMKNDHMNERNKTIEYHETKVGIKEPTYRLLEGYLKIAEHKNMKTMVDDMIEAINELIQKRNIGAVNEWGAKVVLTFE